VAFYFISGIVFEHLDGKHQNIVMTLRKIILVMGAALITQNVSAQLSIAPEVGFQMTDINAKYAGKRINDFKTKPGLRGGVNLDIDIQDHLQLHAGLFYSAKGAVTDAIYTGGGFEKGTLSRNYLELPVYLNYTSGSESSNRFFVGAGPYLAYALSANIKIRDNKTDVKIGTTIGEDGLKPLDLGVSVNAGYKLSMGLYVRAYYSLGLMNTYPGGGSRTFMKNNSFGISAGYAFQLWPQFIHK
jgi:hypothetical protein